MIGTHNVVYTSQGRAGSKPCKCPDQVRQILRVETGQLERSLLGEDVQQVLAGLVPQGSKGPQDVGNVLWLALVSLSPRADSVKEG